MFKVIFLFIASVYGHEYDYFKVGVPQNDRAPYLYYDHNNDPQGLAVSILDSFAKSEGLKFQYVPLNYHRGLKELQNGSIDFLFPDGPNQQSILKEDQLLYYSDNVFEYLEGLVTLSPCPDSLKGLKSLGSLTERYPFIFNPEIIRNKVGLDQHLTNYKILELVLKERISAGYMADSEFFYLQKNNEAFNKLAFCNNLKTDMRALNISSAKWPSILQRLNQYLKKRPHK